LIKKVDWRKEMTEEQWEVLDEISGSIEAEILRGMLEAQDIPVILSQEGAGRALGLTIGALGETQVLVPRNKFESAREILDEFYKSMEDDQTTSDEEE
jgi:hypothetical protein